MSKHLKLKDLNILNVGLTTRCFANCEFCSRNFPYFDKTEIIDLDINLLQRVLDYRVINIINKIVLCGSFGEPTLYPHLLKLIDHLYVNGKHIFLLIKSNGATHDEVWWKDLAKKMKFFKESYVIFGIDGIDNETHTLHRKGTRYDTIINNMKSFIEGGGNAIWQFILFKHNNHQVDEAKKISKKLCCKSFNLIPSHSYDETLMKSKKNLVKTTTCGYLKLNSISIDCEGNVSPCCNFRPKKSRAKGEKIMWNDMLTMIQYIKDKDKLNLYKSTLEEALKSNFFDHLFVKNQFKKIKMCQVCQNIGK